MKHTLTELQEPDVKLLHNGSYALSDAETLGLVMAGVDSTAKANKLLASVNYSFSDLGKYNYSELINFGLSHLQAIRLIAVMEFSRRKAIQPTIAKDYTIRQSKDVADIMQPLIGELDHEEFWVLFLNRSNKVIKRERISVGGLSGTVTDVRILFKSAILNKASGIIVAHNHPSGNLNPSESDTKITQKIKDCGSLMDIQVLDHLIISEKDFYSFADNGII
jgi:DNA repair protein RadC